MSLRSIRAVKSGATAGLPRSAACCLCPAARVFPSRLGTSAASGLCRPDPWPWGLDASHQHKDQQNNDDDAESAAPVVAGAVERPAADAAEAAQQRDD